MGITTDIVSPTDRWYKIEPQDITRKDYVVLIDWLSTCTQGQYLIVSGDQVRFELHEDAVMFKLRWG